jgi:hypothetical protein
MNQRQTETLAHVNSELSIASMPTYDDVYKALADLVAITSQTGGEVDRAQAIIAQISA